MSIKVKQGENQDLLLSISGEISIDTVLLLKAQLFSQIDNATMLQIDLSTVTRIDSAGVQLLMLCKQEAERRQLELHFIRHSQAVVTVLERLNLGGYFGDPIVISADWQAP